jgi:hypothetical protein
LPDYLVKQALLHSNSIDRHVAATAHRYFKFVESVARSFQIRCLLWGPIASVPLDRLPYNPEFPAFGSVIERNYATAIFNWQLADFCEATTLVKHFTIFERLIDPNFITKAEYLYDGCQLSRLALDMAEEELRQALTGLGLLEKLAPAICRVWPISPTPSLRNVAAGRPYTSSSTWGGPSFPFPPEPNGQAAFHTDLEDQPWIIVELGASYLIDTIIVHNRSDLCQERAESIAVALSADGVTFEDVYAPSKPSIFGDGELALRIHVEPRSPARFVKLYLRERNFFHLECVQILAPSFLTA